MGKDRTNFNMQLTMTQREIMDFVTEIAFDGYGYSKAEVVNLLFKHNALNYLNMGIEPHDISDEMLLELLWEQKKSKDLDLIAIMGLAQYENITAKSKEKGLDTSYHEELIEKYKEREVK